MATRVHFDRVQAAADLTLEAGSTLLLGTAGELGSWPVANAVGKLTNDGAGNLSWSASGGGGTVDTIVGTTNEIDVDSTDPANPIVALAAAVIASLGLADTSLQPAAIGVTLQAWSAKLDAYAGGDTPSAFTLGIVDSVDAAAWRAAIGAGTSTVTPAALTKVDDTNVTLTLGGTPATALLQASSLTLGWTGTLAVARGGSGAGTLTGYLKGNGTSAFTASATIPYSDLSGTPTIPVAANPSGLIGMSAVNGVATTWTRSDGTHAIDPAIAPTWTGIHTFNNTVVIGSSISALVTNHASSQIYATSGSGSGDFAEAGNLIIQPRSSLGRDIILMTGTTSPVERVRIDRNGIATFASVPVVPNDSWTYAKIQNVSATSRVLGRITSGAGDIEELTGANLTTIIGGSALTKTDDTNVTLTLGGSPTTALLAAASLTLGWTGTLSVARGGSGAGTLTGHLSGNGTGAFTASATIPYSDLTGTPTIPTAANPTGSVGLSAVNGAAATYMRSDGAPALSQSIAPTWSAAHIFSLVGSGNGSAIRLASATPFIYWSETDAAADAKDWDLGVNSGLFRLRLSNDAGTAKNILAVSRSTGSISAIEYGNATDNNTNTFLGTGTTTFNGGVVGTGATGGAQGAGTGNFTGVYDDGVLLANQAGANPTASVGLSAVNGSAGTFMRSDGAPALSQSIAPTWSALHIFGNADSNLVIQNTAAASNQDNTLLRVNSSGVFAISSATDAAPGTASRNLLQGTRSGVAWTDITFGNGTDNPTFTFAGSGVATFSAVPVVPNDSWTYAKIQNVSATSRILGRVTAGAGDIEEMTGTQATTLLDNFTSTLKGLVPLSGGGTTNFLRADGSWAAPGGGGTPGGSNTQIQYNNSSAFGGVTGFTWNGTVLTVPGNTVISAGSASANSWPTFTAGTLLTTPQDGTIELDNDCFYLTTDAGNRGVVPAMHYIRQESSYNLANSGAAQKLFNAVANGTLTLEAGLYRFECAMSITGMSATSGNLKFGILGAGTSTVSSAMWHSVAFDGANSAIGTPSFGTFLGGGASGVELATATTSTSFQAMIRGVFNVSVAGTIIPSITLTTAVATANVIQGSYFLCHRIGASAAVSVGQWS